MPSAIRKRGLIKSSAPRSRRLTTTWSSFRPTALLGRIRAIYHIYYLYLNTAGFDPNNDSLPAKLTDGPANDTDPAYSKDGQFVAFASTAVTSRGTERS